VLDDHRDGIDVPTANTIIIDRADKFGPRAAAPAARAVSGRSHPPGVRVSASPARGKRCRRRRKKRLEAIQMMEDLGSGFYLAMHDLEIRGAGEVLGDEQVGRDAGSRASSSTTTCCARRCRRSSQGREPDLTEPLGVTTEINLHVPALLPERYCNDVHERLVLYKRSRASSRSRSSTRSRRSSSTASGPRPSQAQALLASHRLRLLAKPLGVRKVDAGPERTTIQFVKHPPFDAGRSSFSCRRTGASASRTRTAFASSGAAPTLAERIALVKDFLARLR
jgi:transcription-repair coupling factor (superfamily II helicase)